MSSLSAWVVAEMYPFLEAKFTTLELIKARWLPTSVIKGIRCLAMFNECVVVMATGMGVCQSVCLVSKHITGFISGFFVGTNVQCPNNIREGIITYLHVYHVLSGWANTILLMFWCLKYVWTALYLTAVNLGLVVVTLLWWLMSLVLTVLETAYIVMVLCKVCSQSKFFSISLHKSLKLTYISLLTLGYILLLLVFILLIVFGVVAGKPNS